MPSSSTISVPTRPQNSSSVCQSRPLRARPGGFQREHGADAALADRGQKLLEAGPSRRPRPIGQDRRRSPRRRPTPAGGPDRPGHTGVAGSRDSAQPGRRRLTDIDDGAPHQMLSRDLRHRPPPAADPSAQARHRFHQQRLELFQRLRPCSAARSSRRLLEQICTARPPSSPSAPPPGIDSPGRG